MKTLNIVQTFSKVGKVFSKIFFIFSIVGVSACAVSILSLNFSDNGLFKIGGVSIYSFVAANNADPNSLYAPIAGIAVFCIGQIVLAKFAEKYFKNELSAGTPFTFDGANELLRLGVLTLAISAGSVILAKIVSGAVAKYIGCGEMPELDIDSFVMCGVMFIALSFIFKYGAEILNEKTEHTPENEEEKNLYE